MSSKKKADAPKQETQQKRPDPSPEGIEETSLEAPASRRLLALPRKPGGQKRRQQVILQLQRLVGNRSVASRLQSGDLQPSEPRPNDESAGRITTDPPPSPKPSKVQRWPWDDDNYTVAGIVADRAADDVGELSDEQIRSASLSQKMGLVRIILNENFWVGPFDEWQLERVWRLMSSTDLEGVVRNPAYRGLMRGSYDRGAAIEISDSQLRNSSIAAKMLYVSMILDGNWWVGPYLEGDLERIWGTVTSSEIEEALSNQTYADLFRRSADRGAEIEDQPPIPTLRAQFQADVRGLASGYLDANEQLVLEEMGSFGIPDRTALPAQPRDTMAPPPGLRTRPLNDDQVGQMQELQAIAAQLRRAEIARDRLLTTHVGYEMSVDARPGLISIATGTSFEEHARDLHQRGDADALWDITFNPVHRPEIGPFGDEDPPLPEYEQVKEHYDQVIAEIGNYSSNYPALYALIQGSDGESQIESFALAEPEQARAIMGERLAEVLGNIRSSRTILASDEDFYLDLKPIHRQMFTGSAAAPSGTSWNEGLANWVGQDEVSDHEAAEFWITLGLGSLAAVAFIVAEFATLGSATFIIATGVGLGAGLIQADRSWEQYEQLATAADATVSDEARLVSQSQADSAYLSAILDTVFLFLDALGPVVRGARAARAASAAPVVAEAAEAGTRAAAVEGLEQLGRQADQAGPVVERAIVELGAEETIRRSGKTVDELIEIVGRDSDAGRRLVAFSRAAETGLESSADLIARLPNLADEMAGGLSRADADRIVLQAVEQLGPQRTLQLAGGWKKLATLLGNDALVGPTLRAWRNRLVRDLEQFVETTLRTEADEAGEALVERTGSTDFTSDLDISLLGPNAAANRQAALSFLAGRTGVPAEDLSRLLYTDLFTDPRRMHLYDLIDDVALREQIVSRTAGFERELIWNRRLYEAVQAGDDATAEAIRRQMSDLGVPHTPYTPLSPGEIRRISGEIDDLHRQLQGAARAGNTAEQARLAERIARKQAMINATEGGGYFSGGGVRHSVSEREGFPGFTAAEAATEARRMLPAQQFTHVLDQLPKLDDALRRLARAERPDQIAAALKGIGKYGERLTSIIGESLARNLPEMAEFSRFASRFEHLIASARGTAVDPLAAQLARSPESLVRETRLAVTQFEQASSGILRVMQQRAALETPGLFGGSLRNMQFLVRAHTNSLAIFDSVIGAMDDFLRAQRTAGRLGESGLRPEAGGSGEEASD